MVRSCSISTLAAIAAGLCFSACQDCGVRELPCDATHDPTIDGAVVDGALPDAMPDAEPDATPDAMLPPLCITAGDTADHLEPLGAAGGNPQMTTDAFGAATANPTATNGTQIALLGADGQRRAPDINLPYQVFAIAFDGLDYRIAERAAGIVQLRTVSAAGVVSAPTVIGTGEPLWGALAVHAGGDVAVVWRAQADGSVRATVVPAVGVPVETVLDAPTGFVNTQLVGGVAATVGTAAHFVAAWARIEGLGNTTTVMARPLAPTGTAQVISTGAATMRQRVQIATGAVADTLLITWRDDNNVHAATYHPVTGIALADRVVITPTNGSFARVAGRGGPGAGFEILIDHHISATDRALVLHAFDAAGDPVGAPRRIATICSNSYSEENLAFVRNASVRYVDWFDLSLPDAIAAAF